MKQFVGIDLGTTNSAICSFDGAEVTLYKSPEQHDVTPSALLIDRRGNKYVGARAYNGAAKNPDNAATHFKRFMGTSTPMRLPAVNLTLTPEECSAEILRVLYGYLPDSIRRSDETGTIITVPAAFNQMQKDATIAAANSAGIGQVAMMQEPVAAVMSVVRRRKGDGSFIVYDLGGGTLDVAIAQCTLGRVSLLAHGGIAMCGGRDFDRLIFDRIITPWLLSHFQLPENFVSDPKHRTMTRMATWVGEKAKIALSAKAEVQISDPDFDGMGFKDERGREIFLDVPLSTQAFDALIADELGRSVTCARETLEKAGLTPHDVSRIVFVGGPTQYKSLREKVAFELGISPSFDVNPMTAVAEGAAVFAEAIDWSSQARSRKASRGALNTGGRLNLSLSYVARTPDAGARVLIKLGSTPPPGSSFQIDSLDTGWSSGRAALRDGASVDVMLAKPGDNTFKLFAFDGSGGPIGLESNRIVIARTAATVDAIPASSSIFVEALSGLGGSPVPAYLVKEGEPLPKKGRERFQTTEALRARGAGAIRFKIWEGEIVNPITDNRYIGALEILGSDFDDGMISVGDDLICDFQILDSGQILLEVTVPKIGGKFQKRNFYARQAGHIDFSAASQQVSSAAEAVRDRVHDVAAKIQSPKLEAALERLTEAATLQPTEMDPDKAKRAMDGVLDAKKILAQVRKEHLREIRQLDLDRCTTFFRDEVKQFASPPEASAFDNLARTAQRSIDENRPDFESHLDQLKGKLFHVMWQQDWFVVDRFKHLSERAFLFPDQTQHSRLVAGGAAALKADDIRALRGIVFELDNARISGGGDDDPFSGVNIVRT
jgi:molecular chaperone DnaK